MSLYADATEARRAAGRRRVAQAANRGELPSAHWPADELAEVFAGAEDQLAELERVAVEKRQAEMERDRLANRRLQVDATAKQLLREWEEAERLEKRRRAYEQAERIVSEREADA